MEQSAGNNKGPGCIPGCAFLLVVVLLLLSLAGNGVMALSLALGNHFSAGFGDDTAVDEFPVLDEVWSYGDGETRVARIAVNGVISRSAEGGFFSPQIDMVEAVIQQIRAAQADETIEAIILEIDSPGGGIAPTDEIYQALMDFRASDPDRRILAFCRDMAASGGYYLAVAADWIVAEPTTMLGSISVIMQALNWKTLSDKIGITDVTITSGEHKDLLNPFQEVSPEEQAILQSMVDGLHAHFMDVVCRGRDLSEAAVNPWADGRVFLPSVALDAKLIDEIGYWDEAMARCSELLGVDAVKVIRYEYSASFLDFMSGVHLGINPRGLLREASPRFMYLWNPTF
ncbi:MAG: signal peptide peptidase SppA [Kiritimatiellae bacterium]|nr:signal peptide peptidase SppA [Kiritimatiellia bacterium]